MNFPQPSSVVGFQQPQPTQPAQPAQPTQPQFGGFQQPAQPAQPTQPQFGGFQQQQQQQQPQPQPGAAAQGWNQGPQGFAPPVNWQNPEIYNYANRGPAFVPYVDNVYQFQLLDFRYRDGTYYADVLCLAAQHQNPGTDDRNGQPVMPCVPGQEYCYPFDLTHTGSEAWKTTKAQARMVAMFAAIRRAEPTPELAQECLQLLTPASREEISKYGFRFIGSARTRASKNGKPVTEFDFSPAQ